MKIAMGNEGIGRLDTENGIRFDDDIVTMQSSHEQSVILQRKGSSSVPECRGKRWVIYKSKHKSDFL